jgi:hypothetical protein
MTEPTQIQPNQDRSNSNPSGEDPVLAFTARGRGRTKKLARKQMMHNALTKLIKYPLASRHQNGKLTGTYSEHATTNQPHKCAQGASIYENNEFPGVHKGREYI